MSGDTHKVTAVVENAHGQRVLVETTAAGGWEAVSRVIIRLAEMTGQRVDPDLLNAYTIVALTAMRV